MHPRICCNAVGLGDSGNAAGLGDSGGEDIFNGQVVIPGKLSYRRKAHFEGKRIRQVEALKNIKKNDIKIPKEVKNNDLYTSTAIINGNIYGSSINFFSKPGLQQFEDNKEIPQIEDFFRSKE